MNLNSQLFSDPSPYPCIQVECENPRYAAAMLSNLGSCCSEMSAVSLYFYNSLLTRECFEEYSHCFKKISMVEMHHMDIFGQLSLLLGTDPRLWEMHGDDMAYWSPACNHYPEKIIALVKNSLAGEKETIKNKGYIYERHDMENYLPRCNDWFTYTWSFCIRFGNRRCICSRKNCYR